MHKVFQQIIHVKADSIDNLNHVNNVVYLQWVQDVAEAHWNTVAPDEVKRKYSWVVLKHEIEYLRPALLNDELILRTWVETMDGAKSERHVEIINKSSTKILTKAKTLWCLLDSETMRPRRIEGDIQSVFSKMKKPLSGL